MNKKFLQSVVTGVVSLGLIASCAQLGLKKESNNCGGKNGCAAKNSDCNKCASKKDKETCKKAEKKAKKAAAVKTEEKKK